MRKAIPDLDALVERAYALAGGELPRAWRNLVVAGGHAACALGLGALVRG